MKSNNPLLWLRTSLAIFTVPLFFSCSSTVSGSQEDQRPISLDHWKYIEVDSQRGKHGDWDDPKWLKYFGLDMQDVTGDNFKDVIAGRYFYRNPGGDMTSSWTRIDLGMNVDGMLFVDADNDGLGDVIATSLPSVYWFEAQDNEGSAWKGIKIGQVPETTHVNGQGYAKAQVIKGGKEEVLLATGNGIYYFIIPDDPETGKWTAVHAATEASDEGFATGDIDGDGLVDIVAGLREGTKEGEGMKILWWKNPGNSEGNWKSFAFGETTFDADRIAVADINGDGRLDAVVTEERYPGPEPDASLFWFGQPKNPQQGNWVRHTVVTQYSLNNLDVADMDRDGDADVVTAEHKGPDLRIQIWQNDGKGNFTASKVDKGKESHLGSRVADLNNDGAPDIISIGWDRHKFLHVWRNDGLIVPQKSERLSWKHYSSANGDFPAPDVANQSATLVLDMDKDGKDEIAIAGWGDTSMVLYKMKGNTWEKYLIDQSNSHIEAGGAVHDMDGDGDPDILHGGSWNTNEVWWWENPYPDFDPATPWRKYTIKDYGSKQHHDQAIGDFDGDKKADLIFWNQQAGKMLIGQIPENPRDKSAWKFEEVFSWNTELKYEGLASGDINGDGTTDIIGGGYWFEHKGNKFEPHMIDQYGQSRAAVGDLIKGGRPEVVLGSGDGVGPLNIYQWNDDRWEKTILIDECIHGHSLQVLDVDSDGNLDIFAAEMVLWHNGNNPGSKTWILYGDGKGNFDKEVIRAATDIGNHESKFGDLNGDGRPDLIQKPFMKDIPRLDIWLNQGSHKAI